MQFIAFTFGFQVVSERVGIVFAFFVRFFGVCDRSSNKKKKKQITNRIKIKIKTKSTELFGEHTNGAFSNVSRYGNVAHINAYFLCSISIGTHVLIWYACECVFFCNRRFQEKSKMQRCSLDTSVAR